MNADLARGVFCLVMGGGGLAVLLICIFQGVCDNVRRLRDKIREWRKGRARKRWLRWRVSKRDQAHLDGAFPWALRTEELRREGYGQPHIRDPNWAKRNQQEER